MIKITILFKSAYKAMTSTQGFSLIELIMSVVLLGFVLSSLIKLYSDLSILTVSPHYRATQTMLAQELMEEIRSKDFDEFLDKDASGNWSATLAADSGETAGDSSTYDDADDFNGWNETLSAPFTGFTRTVAVSYVDGSDLNTPLTIPTPVTPDWTPEFKQVVVTVDHNAVDALTIQSIVSTAKSRDKVL